MEILKCFKECWPSCKQDRNEGSVVINLLDNFHVTNVLKALNVKMFIRRNGRINDSKYCHRN